MEKLIIGVIASKSEAYNLMKRNWEINADSCNSNIEVYFLYGDENLETSYSIEKNTKNTYNFYCKCEEKFKNLLYKSIEFFEWVILNNPKCMVIRSNLSTLFELDGIFNLYKDFYKYKFFFGGTFIQGYLSLNSGFSGANLTFSIETLKLIVYYKNDLLNIDKNDDVVLSEFIFHNYYSLHYFYNLKRLDFTDKILFQFMELNDLENVFCYRFKSSDRIKDNKLMLEIINKSFDKNFIKDKVLYDYKEYIKVYHDYNDLKNGKALICNTLIDTSLQGTVKNCKMSFVNKYVLKRENENEKDITLFRILKD
jgi:hypothetical protein